jgi:HEAT repeat protein
MVNNTNQLLLQAQSAENTADWSSLIHYLQQLILQDGLKDPRLVQEVGDLALSVLLMGDFQQRWEIAKVFTRLGEVTIPALIEILEDEDTDEELCWYTVRILGELKNPKAIASVIELLKHQKNEELASTAAAALGQMGKEAIAALSELLLQENTRLLAVRSLSYIRCKETIPPLLSVVEDPEVTIRAAVIEALSSFHNEQVAPILLAALNDVSAIVRKEAVTGLGFRADLCQQLDLVAKLQPSLYDLNLEVCCAAAVALSRMQTDKSAQYLFKVLISPHTPLKLQIEAIRALGWLSTPTGLEYLQQAFYQHCSPTLWQEIVTVLGRVQAPITAQASEILLKILELNHPAIEIPSIKSAIALSLGQLGCLCAIKPLTKLSVDQNTTVKLHAIAALKNLTY